MNSYIKYLSTRPKQTHIKCFSEDNRQEKNNIIYNYKYNIHIYMNSYVKYLSTRPKQTHIKCFYEDNLQEKKIKTLIYN